MPTVSGNSSPITITGLTPEVSYTFNVAAVNGIGRSNSYSFTSATITPTNYPLNTSLPTISGSLYETSTLSCTTGSWSSVVTPGSYAYQWQRAGANIASATSSTYVLTASDVGNAIRCLVVATNGAYSTTANSANTAAISAQGNVTSVSYMVVAGGGGGSVNTSFNTGGGGGGGGVRASTLSVSVGSTYSVTVGSGGASQIRGTNSSFSTINATGGGGGGSPGGTGGSGGGGSGGSGAAGGTGNLGGYTPVEGYAGSAGSSLWGGGAGGGASAAGGTPGGSGNYGGNGGSGTTAIDGTGVGGGGGGGCNYQGLGRGSGGYGGGGNGTYTTNGSAGTYGTGGGGGGGATKDSGGTGTSGFSGGSGVVFVYYSEAYKAANTTTGSPTYTRSGGNHIYKWYGAGSIKF